MNGQDETCIELATRSKSGTIVGSATAKGLYGSDAMRKAAAEALRVHCVAIANKLAEKAAQGNVQCARLLLDLADQEKELNLAQGQRVKRSLATEWANQPEWIAVIEEAKADDARKTLARENARLILAGSH